MELYLDGNLLTNTETSAIKRQPDGLLNDGGILIPIHSGWFEQTGAFFGPGQLTVGAHSFSATVVVPGFGEFPIPPITFHIDGSGAGACS
jgi:hypothetical protein